MSGTAARLASIHCWWDHPYLLSLIVIHYVGAWNVFWRGMRFCTVVGVVGYVYYAAHVVQLHAAVHCSDNMCGSTTPSQAPV